MMGRIGYLYESVKDQLRWHSLSVKRYEGLIFSIGDIMALNDEDYKKAKAKYMKMKNSEMIDALLAAWGDGT